MQIPGSEQWADGPGLRALEPTCSHSFEPVLTRAALVGSLNTLSLFNGLIITTRPISYGLPTINIDTFI